MDRAIQTTPKVPESESVEEEQTQHCEVQTEPVDVIQEQTQEVPSQLRDASNLQRISLPDSFA